MKQKRNKLINRQKNNAPGKKVLRVFVLLGVISIFVLLNIFYIFIYDLLTQCDYFNAKTITVSGTNHLLTREVIEQANLSLNQNILSINLNKTKLNIINNPWVEQVLVKRKYPSTIVIKIIEHVPYAILVLDQKYIINNKGKIFKEWKKGDLEDVPLITGIDYRDIITDKKEGSFCYAQALDVVKFKIEYENKFNQLKIKKIVTDREIGITVIPERYKFSIYIGFNKISEKFNKLFYVIKYLKQINKLDAVVSINLNSINRVIIKPV
jgi:cell division protein FtsQ